MNLIVIRHGKAERGNGDDAARMLTDEGIEQSRHLGKRLAALELEPDAVFASPYLRARQTAERTLAAMSIAPEMITTCDDLTPDGRPDAFLERIEACRAKTVYCFTHAPFCDTLVARALGLRHPVTAMKTATAASLNLGGDGPAMLAWLAAPAVLYGKT